MRQHHDHHHRYNRTIDRMTRVFFSDIPPPVALIVRGVTMWDGSLGFEVIDPATGLIIYTGEGRGASEWLARQGYGLVHRSNGVYQRATAT